MEISEIKTLMKSGDVVSASEKLSLLLETEPDNQEAKLLYGTCRHICGDDETFIRIDDEVAKDPDFCHKRVYRNYHAMRVAAYGLAALSFVSCMEPQISGAATVYGMSTLYAAHCYTDTVRIYFRSGGGTGSMSAVTKRVNTCSSGIRYYLPTCKFTRPGYAFAGWSVDTVCSSSSAMQPGAGLDIVGECGDFYLTATWRAVANQSYTLTVDPQGGILNGPNFGSLDGTDWSASVAVTYGRMAYWSLGNARRSGYTFTGWWTSPSGGTRVFDSNGNCVVGGYWNSAKQWIYRGNVTLYAQWRR